MIIPLKYEVTYTDGGGEVYHDGTWQLTRTPKRLVAEKIAHYMSGVYSMHEVGYKARIGTHTGNPCREYEDGTITVYFDQAGTSYDFVPVE